MYTRKYHCLFNEFNVLHILHYITYKGKRLFHYVYNWKNYFFFIFNTYMNCIYNNLTKSSLNIYKVLLSYRKKYDYSSPVTFYVRTMSTKWVPVFDKGTFNATKWSWAAAAGRPGWRFTRALLWKFCRNILQLT